MAACQLHAGRRPFCFCRGSLDPLLSCLRLLSLVTGRQGSLIEIEQGVLRTNVITAARAGVCQPGGCSILHVFLISFFIKQISVKTAERRLAPNMAGRRV